MAFRNYRNNSKGKGRGKKNSRYSEQEKFAYRLGQVNRGLKNPNSLISESYVNGRTPKEKKPNKTLY